MTIQDLKNQNLIILECISGSRAYKLDTPKSDTDIRGVFILPKKEFYGLNYIAQVNDATNDTVYYELGRFMELLALNNPNILELLNTPEHAILYKHPLLEILKPELILSKRCRDTFGKYAYSQIKKAKGLEKKILNPMEKERKGALSFCFAMDGKKSIPLLEFLKSNQMEEGNCGLANIPNMKNIYGLFYGEEFGFSGVVKNADSNEVSLSSIPKELQPKTFLYFNKDGYSTYCKKYKEYWNWVEKRNEARYENTLSHGKKYDSKNMMHTFRLLEMAIEIGRDNAVNVVRPNRDFLLGIKNGEYEYEELLAMAESRQGEMEQAFENSDLPEQPDVELIGRLAFKLRNALYDNLASSS
jgi:hypothetical protein